VALWKVFGNCVYTVYMSLDCCFSLKAEARSGNPGNCNRLSCS